MKSSFVLAGAASLLTSVAPGALALPSSNHQQSAGRSLSLQHQSAGRGVSLQPRQNMTAEAVDWDKVGNDIKNGFDKVGDWFKDLPEELKELNDKVGDDIKKGAKEAWELDLGGCLLVQCATALAPTALTCVVSLIGSNPLGCVGAVSPNQSLHTVFPSFLALPRTV